MGGWWWRGLSEMAVCSYTCHIFFNLARVARSSQSAFSQSRNALCSLAQGYDWTHIFGPARSGSCSCEDIQLLLLLLLTKRTSVLNSMCMRTRLGYVGAEAGAIGLECLDRRMTEGDSPPCLQPSLARTIFERCDCALAGWVISDVRG